MFTLKAVFKYPLSESEHSNARLKLVFLRKSFKFGGIIIEVKLRVMILSIFFFFFNVT